MRSHTIIHQSAPIDTTDKQANKKHFHIDTHLLIDLQSLSFHHLQENTGKVGSALTHCGLVVP